MNKSFFKNKTILITGGTGSLGKKLVKNLLKFDVKKIIIFSRDEQKQYYMARDKNFDAAKNKNLRYFIGDVRDFDRLTYALENVDFVIHAAALKHVDVAEYNPDEFIKTNISGTKNIIRASINNNVKNILGVSTDKAVNPINLYGGTKLVSEKMLVAANNIVGNKKSKFSVVRYGNVIASRGSVIEKFREISVSKNKIFPITDPKMTRFFIILEESANFVLKNLTRMYGGEIFVPKMPSINLIDLIKVFKTNPKIKVIGLRPGEKLHEVLVAKEEINYVNEFKDFFIIKPQIKFNKNYTYKKTLINEISIKKKIINEYNSLNNKEYYNSKELKKKILSD